MVMDNDQIRLKLIDPYFRKFINWRGIENVLEIPKDRLKNVLHQYKGYHFTAEDAFKINGLFERIGAHFTSDLLINEKLFESDYRRILNWTAIEKELVFSQQRLKNVLVGKYQKFTEEEILKLEAFLNNLVLHFTNEK
jgi:hypothetical protein